MFRYEKCSHQAVHCANHDRNMFILITIETDLDHDKTKHVKKGARMRGEGECPIAQDPKLGLL